MGKIKGKWQGQLKGAQASGLSLAEYAAQHGSTCEDSTKRDMRGQGRRRMAPIAFRRTRH